MSASAIISARDPERAKAPRSRADFVLSQQAQKFWDGNEREVILFLQEMGCVVIESDEKNGVWSLDGVTGIRVGLCRGLDPIAVTVQIGFLLAGMLFTSVYPDALKMTAEWWEAQTKRRRSSVPANARKKQPGTKSGSVMPCNEGTGTHRGSQAKRESE